MPSDHVDLRMVCGMGGAKPHCPACGSPNVLAAFAIVTADYLTCQSCEHTWSVPRAETSAAFRITRIVQARRTMATS